MSLSQPSYRDEVENTYLTLEQNFDTLYQQCSTADQKRQLSDLHSVARYAFWKAGEQARPDEGGVGATFQDLKMVNMKLNAMLKNLDDIGAFLSLAEEAVRLAESPTPPPADA